MPAAEEPPAACTCTYPAALSGTRSGGEESDKSCLNPCPRYGEREVIRPAVWGVELDEADLRLLLEKDDDEDAAAAPEWPWLPAVPRGAAAWPDDEEEEEEEEEKEVEEEEEEEEEEQAVESSNSRKASRSAEAVDEAATYCGAVFC